MKKTLIMSFLAGLIFLSACSQASGPTSGQFSGPKLGEAASGPMLDKTGDATLNNLIANVLPRFRQLEFGAGSEVMSYNLFVPEKLAAGKKYPLVLFMADASTAGRDVKAPLSQGYGALVFASPEAQAKNPCFVLVPQFSGVAVDDSYRHTPEVEQVLELLKAVAAKYPVDTERLYATGQSMGGMIAMFLNVAYPDIFAASLFVDCHWDQGTFDNLVKHPFIFVSAGDRGKSRASLTAIEDAARKMGVSYTWAEWSARLPLATQDALAKTMLDKDQPINLIGFDNGTVLPEDGKGSEHMHSFDKAYQLAPVREWLFGHVLTKPGLNK